MRPFSSLLEKLKVGTKLSLGLGVMLLAITLTAQSIQCDRLLLAELDPAHFRLGHAKDASDAHTGSLLQANAALLANGLGTQFPLLHSQIQDFDYACALAALSAAAAEQIELI